MRVQIEIPALLAEGSWPLASGQQEAARAVLADLASRWFRITATNRLKPADHAHNRYLRDLADCVTWDVGPSSLTGWIETEGHEDDARAALHWLEIAWASCWTSTRHETTFARPFPELDLTVTLDPVAVINRVTDHPMALVGRTLVFEGAPGQCRCRLCLYCRPRIDKWGVKRAGFSELYRRLGEGESVAAGEIFPLIGGGGNVKAAGLEPAKKGDEITAERAIQWLALNPRRAFR